jgi:hypothetical protein
MISIRGWACGAALLGSLTIIFLALAAAAQSPGPAATTEAYQPEIGEIMTFQQMRHGKLWFAAQAGNWPLAAYETGELREGFEAVAKYYPTFNNVPLAQMIDAIRETNFAELDKAIAARDRKQFTRAFDGLSAACNACHQANDLGFIVLQRPTASPFSNQSYVPRK